MMRQLRAALTVALLSVPGSGPAWAEAPRVVVSIPPIHSLVAGVMEGIGRPDLLLSGASSAHSYAMRPSDARALDAAQVIFWVGEAYETFLAGPLAGLGRKARVVELSEDTGLRLLEYREGGPWEAEERADAGHAHGSGEGNAGGAHGHAAHDMHLWLDPENAGRIAAHAAAVLGEVDPANSARYAANAERLEARLRQLDERLRRELTEVRGLPFIVFHDAYQYLERAYGLRAVGSVTVSPETPPGAKRLYEIRSKIVDAGARCVFAEPQFDARLVRVVVSGTPARGAELDPLGAALEPGPDLYFLLMENLAGALKACLSAPS